MVVKSVMNSHTVIVVKSMMNSHTVMVVTSDSKVSDELSLCHGSKVC